MRQITACYELMACGVCVVDVQVLHKVNKGSATILRG